MKLVGRGLPRAWLFVGPKSGALLRADSVQGQLVAGSLTGAVHLSNDNAGVLRSAQ